MENKTLEQPFLDNILRFMEETGIPENDKILFRDGAQYGFNLRDVFCEDLKKDVIELGAEIKRLNTYISIEDRKPRMYERVIRTSARIIGHPEYDNQCIDFLTEDCNTGEVIWSCDKRKPTNEFWMPLATPPDKH